MATNRQQAATWVPWALRAFLPALFAGDTKCQKTTTWRSGRRYSFQNYGAEGFSSLKLKLKLKSGSFHSERFKDGDLKDQLSPRNDLSCSMFSTEKRGGKLPQSFGLNGVVLNSVEQSQIAQTPFYAVQFAHRFHRLRLLLYYLIDLNLETDISYNLLSKSGLVI